MRVPNFGARFLSAAALFLGAQIMVATAHACESHEAGGQWRVEADPVAGFDVAQLCDVLTGVVRGNVNFHGVVVERHGRIVAEAYRRGKDESIYTLFASTTNFDATTRHDVRSVSKSIVSLLWGIADSQGKMPPLNSRVVDLLPELKNLRSAGRETITIESLFTMSSGLDWKEGGNYGLFSNDETGLYWHSSQARYVFKRYMAALSGAHFNYNSGGTAVLAQILAERVGMSLPDYARKYLFEPLGITDWEWKKDVRGRPLAFAGVRMRPRDVARIGRMVLAQGEFDGKQIVPAAWLKESLRAHVDADFGLRYGYFWWTGEVEALGTKHAWSAGFGNGGQRLFLVPDLDTVIVVTAGDYNKAAINRESSQLFNRILAAVRE